MRWSDLIPVAVASAALGLAVPADAQAAAGYVLTASSYTTTSYAPTFTGNGYLGVRVPPAGQGYAAGTVPAQSELAGFYAEPTAPASVSDAVQQRANIPTWSTLEFGDGTDTFSTSSGIMSGWRQSLDLHTGIITTAGTWTADDGKQTSFTYSVFTDRADANVAVVSLSFTPQWTGEATITDEIDGTPATLTEPVTSGVNAAAREIYDEVVTQTTGIQAAIVSQLATSPDVSAGPPVEVDATGQSIGQEIVFPVSAGQTYTATKYVGVDDSQDSSDPLATATEAAVEAQLAGVQAITQSNDAAWAALWTGRIDVQGNPTLASDVNASEFYLWSNTRDGVNWSISPAGLSSNGYDGHIFWDAETWMYPSLLAQHPDLAGGMDNYRLDRLSAAEQHAAQTGLTGARFPWESALDGTEQIPPPVQINSEGLYEMHITADIALAQWQYYLVTGDRAWLSADGWPVISQAADFWASKATPAAGGGYDIDNVTGPDEENPDVNDEAYTVTGARTTLEAAIAAAGVLGVAAPAKWATVARGLSVPVRDGVHPEFKGYAGQLVKQADVTLLQYPWSVPMPPAVAQADIDYYVPRTDPGGPSMSDAVNEIDTSALDTPGCSSYVFTERSVQPFIRDVFDQFSETRYGGAFTFMTGIGGFLQEFLYGYSGLRWEPAGIQLHPNLVSGIGGVVLHDLRWRGRVFTLAIGSRQSSLTLERGSPLPVQVDGSEQTVREGHPLRLATARPDLDPTSDVVRCQRATATSSEPGATPLAAVDGSPATAWQPTRLPASLTVSVSSGIETISRVNILWGRLWPQVTAPNVPPSPTPVKTLRAVDYIVEVSENGRTWRTVARVAGVRSRLSDELAFPPTPARAIRLVLSSGSQPPIQPTKQDQNPPLTTPLLEELTVR